MRSGSSVWVIATRESIVGVSEVTESAGGEGSAGFDGSVVVCGTGGFGGENLGGGVGGVNLLVWNKR
jgi:hypothetical protein